MSEPNNYAITGIDIKAKKRVEISMRSTQLSCKWSLGFYKKQFKGIYTMLIVQKVADNMNPTPSN